MTHCLAQQAMNNIDGEGFTPHNADRWCEYFKGEITYGADTPEPPKGALWRTYKFEDGSMMNVHIRGCTVFYREDNETRYQHLPDPDLRRLY